MADRGRPIIARVPEGRRIRGYGPAIPAVGLAEEIQGPGADSPSAIGLLLLSAGTGIRPIRQSRLKRASWIPDAPVGGLERRLLGSYAAQSLE